MNAKEYQAILRAAAEVLGGAMHIVNAEGITILYNEEKAKLEKTKINNVIGKPFREVFSNIPEEESIRKLTKDEILDEQSEKLQAEYI